MRFFSKFSNSSKIKKLENQASDILILPNELKALRVGNEVSIVDYSKNKIIDSFEDIFPSNPARATYKIMQKLKLSTNYDEYREALDKKESKEKEIWTCSFRESEDRWVWYKNSLPQMTVSFREAYPDFDFANTNDVEDKIDFCSAKYGTIIIDQIKVKGVNLVASNVNALVLENSYTKIKCSHCDTIENYTIDDLVDVDRKAVYDSKYVVCGNCDKLIKLI